MVLELSLIEIIAILTLSLSVAGTFAGILWSIWKRVETNHQIVMKSIDSMDDDIKDGDRELSVELSKFQLSVSQQYATNSQISDLERKWIGETERLHSAISGLTSRIDRMLTRIDDSYNRGERR